MCSLYTEHLTNPQLAVKFHLDQMNSTRRLFKLAPLTVEQNREGILAALKTRTDKLKRTDVRHAVQSLFVAIDALEAQS